MLLVIVGVQVHPVINYSHHVFFRDKRVIKDLGKGRGEGRELARKDVARDVESRMLSAAHTLLVLDLRSLFLDIWINAIIALWFQMNLRCPSNILSPSLTLK